MQSNNSQRTPEHQSSPEGQALSIRLSIIPDSVAFFESVTAALPEVIQSQPAPRLVPRQVMNPVVEHALNQPTLAEEAYKALDEIHGGNNEYQAAA